LYREIQNGLLTPYFNQLGAGTGVPGITAAKCGAHVIFSDREGCPHFQEPMRESCDINGLPDCDMVEITWGEFSPTLIRLPAVDFVIASDCFYESKGIATPSASIYFY